MDADTAPRGPVAEPERIEVLDVLRGVALLGVFVANVPWMSVAALVADALENAVGSDSAIDAATKLFVAFFVDTKFITIFSTLFGVGLGLMSERALAAGAGTPFAKTYARRLGFLLLVGLAHGFLIWFGDILATYALLGFVAMLFRRRRVKTLLVWAAILFVLAGALSAGMMATDPDDWRTVRKGPDGAPLSADEAFAVETREFADTFSSGDFLRMLPVRAEGYATAFLVNIGFWGPRTLALFLLGIAIVKSGVLARLATGARTLRRLVAIGFAVGLPLHVVHVVLGERMDEPASRVLMLVALYLGGPALSLAYAALVALWTLAPARAPRLRAMFAAVGRMAFTNYLLQSVVGAIVFNYIGLFDRVGRAGGLVFALVVFSLQMLASEWWLARFRMGPLEWVWRAATYGARPALRRSVPALS